LTSTVSTVTPGTCLSARKIAAEELLLGTESYDYVGQSGTVVRDTTISPEKASNATGEIKAGHRATAMRLVTAIVDEPGQRP
jgi:hypothetical protein